MVLHIDHEPDALSTPVVLKTSFEGSFGLGLMVAWVSAMVAYLLVWVAFGSRSNITNLIVGLTAVLAGTLTAMLHCRKYAGVTAEIDRERITVFKNGNQIQKCQWEEMTVTRKWLDQRYLSDQNSVIFPFEALFSGRNQEIGLVRQIVRTRIRKIDAQEPRKVVPVIIGCLVGFILGLAGFFTYDSASNNYASTIANPASTSLQHLVASAYILVICLMMIGCSSPLIIFMMVVTHFERKYPRSLDGVQRYIFEKRGCLEAVEMRPTKWYRYIADIKMRNEFDNIVALVYLLHLALIFAFIMPGKPNHPGVAAPVFAVPLFRTISATAIIFFIVFAARFLQRKRALCTLLCWTGSIYEIRTARGQQFLCTVSKIPKQKHGSSTKFGNLIWRFKASDGKTYRFDPRYFVPVEPNDILTKEATL